MQSSTHWDGSKTSSTLSPVVITLLYPLCLLCPVLCALLSNYLRSQLDAHALLTPQNPMVVTNEFGMPHITTGAGRTNKKDSWMSFDTVDIHRINKHIPAKGAGQLYDNIK